MSCFVAKGKGFSGRTCARPEFAEMNKVRFELQVFTVNISAKSASSNRFRKEPGGFLKFLRKGTKEEGKDAGCRGCSSSPKGECSRNVHMHVLFLPPSFKHHSYAVLQ